MSDLEDLRSAIEGGTAFARTLGSELISLGDGAATLRLDAPESLHNHLGGPHAAALFGLGETTAAAVVVSVFRDLLADGVVPLIKSADIRYLAIATGPIVATARFGGEEDGIRESVGQRGVAVFPVEVTMRTETGTDCCAMTALMALKRF